MLGPFLPSSAPLSIIFRDLGAVKSKKKKKKAQQNKALKESLFKQKNKACCWHHFGMADLSSFQINLLLPGSLETPEESGPCADGKRTELVLWLVYC